MSFGKGMLWVLAAVLIAASANALATTVEEFVVTVRIVDQGQLEKLHVDQTVKVSNDGVLTFFSGGEFAGTEVAPPLEFGTRITGKLSGSAGETKTLTLKIELSHRFDNGETTTPIVLGEMVALKADLKPGETARIFVGKSRWCELRLVRQEK